MENGSDSFLSIVGIAWSGFTKLDLCRTLEQHSFDTEQGYIMTPTHIEHDPLAPIIGDKAQENSEVASNGSKSKSD